MFAGTFESFITWSRLPASVLAAGIAIKLMDDYLDAEGDRRAGTATWAASLGAGVVPYCLLAVTVALLLDVRVASVLVLGAYAVGMTHDLGRALPSGLKGWHESLFAFGLAVLAAGWSAAAAGLAAMSFVQCVDDIEDATGDWERRQSNLVLTLGPVETALLAVASLIVAVSLSPALATTVLGAVAVIEWLFHRTPLRLPGDTPGQPSDRVRADWVRACQPTDRNQEAGPHDD